jgi:hypothetical protein
LICAVETQRTGMVTSAGELVALLLSNVLQDFMNVMRLYVAPSYIVRRIINTSADGDGSSGRRAGGHSAHTDSTLGEFKDVITSMVATDAEEFRLAHTLRAIAAGDLFELLKAKGRAMRRAHRHSDLARARRQAGTTATATGGTDGDVGLTLYQDAEKPLPKPPGSPVGRQLPSRPSNLSLGAQSASPPAGSDSSYGDGGGSNVMVYSPSLLREMGRRSRLLQFRAGMQRTLAASANANAGAREASQYSSLLKTRMVPYVNPMLDTSALVRVPGTLPSAAMNTCEYSGVMND